MIRSLLLFFVFAFLVANLVPFFGVIPATAPDVPWASIIGTLAVALPLGAFIGAAFMRSMAEGERKRYRATPSTADDAAGEAKAEAWDRAADQLLQLRGIVSTLLPPSNTSAAVVSAVAGAQAAFLDAHKVVEGVPHFTDTRGSVAPAAPR